MGQAEFSPLGLDLFGNPIRQGADSPVAQRYLQAPFTVLNGREGDWQARKQAWHSLGLRSELGRGSTVLPCTVLDVPPDSWMHRGGKEGGSIFDPVLCELLVRWFSPPGGVVLDPFAGGSVRGVVAAACGRRYHGVELRAEQVAANVQQWEEIEPKLVGRVAGGAQHVEGAGRLDLTQAPEAKVEQPVWVVGNSAQPLDTAPHADFIMSCPPYGDLEQYSDDPADLSNMAWPQFVDAYTRCIANACARLREDSFAAFVVGDFRDPSGRYRDFPGVTTAAFHAAGLHLYNEAVFVTPVGSAALRVTRQFNGGRKLVKSHQNVLVYVRGDWKRATRKLGEVEC